MRGFDWNWLALFSLSCVYTYRYNHAHIVSINEILATHRHIQHAAICTTKIHHSIGYNPLLQEKLNKTTSTNWQTIGSQLDSCTGTTHTIYNKSITTLGVYTFSFFHSRIFIHRYANCYKLVLIFDKNTYIHTFILYSILMI